MHLIIKQQNTIFTKGRKDTDFATFLKHLIFSLEYKFVPIRRAFTTHRSLLNSFQIELDDKGASSGCVGRLYLNIESSKSKTHQLLRRWSYRYGKILISQIWENMQSQRVQAVAVVKCCVSILEKGQLKTNGNYSLGDCSN